MVEATKRSASLRSARTLRESKLPVMEPYTMSSTSKLMPTDSLAMPVTAGIN